jgi:putative endonuclease
MQAWSIYIVRCNDNSLYTGITLDINRRLIEHTSSNKGAKYLQGKGPLDLVFSFVVGEKSDAYKLERLIKKLPKKDKEHLIKNPDQIKLLLATL